MKDMCVQIAKIIEGYIDDLNLDESHYDESLVELGISSIAFIQIIVEIEDKYQIEIPDEYLLFSKLGTVYKMATIVMSLRENMAE